MNGNVEVGALVALAGVATASATAIIVKHRTNPSRRERERRISLATKGRFGEGLLTDVDLEAGLLHYSYTVRGVQYAASQDVSQLRELLEGKDLDRLIGPVTLKYSVRNPANSILISETWSGLR